jgi:predicted transcriptional regulator
VSDNDAPANTAELTAAIGHLAVRHDLTPAQYRERFELKPDYPMAAPNYVQQRREVALRTRPGKAEEAGSAWEEGERAAAGCRTRRAEE